jgi:hypothetical protein
MFFFIYVSFEYVCDRFQHLLDLISRLDFLCTFPHLDDIMVTSCSNEVQLKVPDICINCFHLWLFELRENEQTMQGSTKSA